MKTITQRQLLELVSPYIGDLPVVLRVGGQEYGIDDVFFSTDEKMQDAKITIETWIKADDENEPGIII